MRLVLATAFALSLAASGARAARLKDIVDVEGFRPNQLVGVGLVVGLSQTGDDMGSLSTMQPLATLMRHLGVVIDPTVIRTRDTALVMVTADLPPFGRPGMAIDVTVSAAGTARSLQGGTLLATALKGADRQTYALAQGPLTVGGYEITGFSGSSSRKNQVTVGRIPSGGRVEREAPAELPKEEVVLLLRDPDFTTAARVAQAVAPVVGDDGSVKLRNPATVVVTPGSSLRGKMVEFIATLESLEATPDVPARVVIDERSGTVVVGASVTLGAAAVAHGGLTVDVREKQEVSQPNQFAPPGAQTVVVPQTQVKIEEKGGPMQAIGPATTVADVAAALNALGVKPRELVTILQALKAAGALHAELQVL